MHSLHLTATSRGGLVWLRQKSGEKSKGEWEKSMNICLIKVRYEMENTINDIRVDRTLRNIVTGYREELSIPSLKL